MESARVVCISDTHLRRRGGLPAWCLTRIAGADLVLHSGDVVASSVYDELITLAPLEAVHGNMDELALKVALPPCQIAKIGGVCIGLIHDAGPAAGRAQRLVQDFPDCQAIVYGHTHAASIENLNGCLVLNPGSPTAPRSELGPTMVELTIRAGQVSASIVTP